MQLRAKSEFQKSHSNNEQKPYKYMLCLSWQNTITNGQEYLTFPVWTCQLNYTFKSIQTREKNE